MASNKIMEMIKVKTDIYNNQNNKLKKINKNFYLVGNNGNVYIFSDKNNITKSIKIGYLDYNKQQLIFDKGIQL